MTVGRPISKKILQYRAIKKHLKSGLSANQIQKKLREEKLGIRRKKLLQEIRLIEKREKPLAQRQKYIPLKYRKRLAPPPKIKTESIFRLCVVMNNVPISSRLFNRNYLGMRICGFSFNPSLLDIGKLKEELYKQVEHYIKYNRSVWWWTPEIGIKYVEEINIHNPQMLNSRWIFRVEKDGIEKYERSGFL